MDRFDWQLRRDELKESDKPRAAIAYLRAHARDVGYDGGGDHLHAIADWLETKFPDRSTLGHSISTGTARP